MESVRRKSGLRMEDRQPCSRNRTALEAQSLAEIVDRAGADFEQLSKQRRQRRHPREFHHRRPHNPRLRPFRPQRIKQSAELLLEPRHGMKILRVVRTDRKHDMRPAVCGEIGKDMVAQLPCRRRVEAGRAPVDRPPGAFGIQSGELRRQPIFRMADANRRRRGIAEHQQRNSRFLAVNPMQHRPLGRQHPFGTPAHAEPLPDINREGEPSEER